MSVTRQIRAAGWALAAALGLQACGGGGGSAGEPLLGGGSSNNNNGGGVVVTPPQPTGPLPASETLAQQCAAGNELAPSGRRNSSLEVEKRWIRSYMDEDYLWREQVPARDPAAPRYSGSEVQRALAAYFYDLLTPQLTSSGAERDRFSFMVAESEWQRVMQAGVSLGYGLEWTQAASTPPRGLRIAYLEPDGPAARAGLRRGDRLLSVDGISSDTNDEAQWRQLQAALYPSERGRSHQFRFEPRGGGGERQLTLGGTEISRTPVPQAQVLTAADGARVGYLVFHDHNLPAEAQLSTALRRFGEQGVSELVLDLRYNGGGYLFIASQLAYMIAGPGPTSGRVFERLRHNSRRQAENEDMGFRGQSCQPQNGQCSQQQALPSLNLRRVYVLSQSGTCSASESLINGLRGIDVEVVLIGGRSCGKPYGFSGRENCGNRYMAIEFEGVNAKGFGDYADGFVPGGSGVGASVKGCEVADDLGRELGDPQEGQLAAALQHRLSGQCPAPQAKIQSHRGGEGGLAAQLHKPWLRNNRLLGQ